MPSASRVAGSGMDSNGAIIGTGNRDRRRNIADRASVDPFALAISICPPRICRAGSMGWNLDLVALISWGYRRARHHTPIVAAHHSNCRGTEARIAAIPGAAFQFLIAFGLVLPVLGGGHLLGRMAREFPPPRMPSVEGLAFYVSLFGIPSGGFVFASCLLQLSLKSRRRRGPRRLYPDSLSTLRFPAWVIGLLALLIPVAVAVDTLSSGSGRPWMIRNRCCGGFPSKDSSR